MTNPEMQPQEPEGVRLLRLIGREDKIGTYLPDQHRVDGQPVKVEDFMSLYPAGKTPSARILFEALESMPATPATEENRKEIIEALQAGIDFYTQDSNVIQSPEA